MMEKRNKQSKFYAVAIGRTTGVFTTWAECQQQVKHYSGAKFKSFATQREAQAFVEKVSSQPVAGSGSNSSNSQNGNKDTKKSSRQQRRHASCPSNDANPNRGNSSKTANDAATTTSSSKMKRKMASDDDPKEAVTNKRIKINEEPQKMTFWKVSIMFDGGSRGNPGSAGAGALVALSSSRDGSSFVDDKKIRVRYYLGKATNNQAEYCGLVKGLEAARDEVKSFGSVNVHIIVQGDSQLIIKQLTGDYQCKNASLKVYLAQARKLVGEMSQLCNALKIEYKHVLRAYNTIADGLANQAMDAEKSWLTIDEDV